MYPETMQREKSSSWLLVWLTVLLFFFSYGNQLIYHYSVPPGWDPLAHNRYVKLLLEGHYEVLYQYHTAWHSIVALLSTLTHQDGLLVMAWLGPLLLVTMGLSLFVFSRRYFGFVAGISSFILMGFFSLQPLQTLNDGGFPNVLAAGTVLPFVFILLDNVMAAKRKFWPSVAFIFGLILLAFCHHLTTLYTLGVLFVFSLVLLWRKGRQRHISRLVLFIILIALIVLSIVALKFILESPIPGSVKSLAAQFVHIDSVFPFIHFIGAPDGPDALWPWSIYISDIGQAVIVLGVAGFLVALANMLTQSDHPQWRIYTLLVIWPLLLFGGSRFASLSDPGRLARDMSVPLCLLGGMFVGCLHDLTKERHLPRWIFGIVIVALFVNGYPVLVRRVHDIIKPNPLIAHLPVDQAMADYINQEIPDTARILAFQEDIYLDYFTPKRQVDWMYASDKIVSLVTYTNPYPVLKTYDYIYFEERYNKPRGFINNPDIIKNYLHSPYTQLVAEFDQPDKKVYLFKVLHKVP